MEKLTNYFLLVFCFLFCIIAPIFTENYAEAAAGGGSAVKLFVFGDSYSDTGNTIPSTACWKPPYGMTFPGNPSGRFSDGHIFTDYIASFLGVDSPIPYNKRNSSSQLQNGMNFAHGGTGVFDTLINEPNMTTQIDFFQQLLDQEKRGGFSLDSSIALITLAGNDYTAYVEKNPGNIFKLKSFTRSVIKQLGTNILRLQGLGVQKIAVTAMEPAGCLPALAFLTLYTECADIWNSISKFHNKVLNETVLQKTSNDSVMILDLYNAFLTALKGQNQTGSLKLEQILKPCCEGVSLEYSCGSTDDSGAAKYVVCKNPEQAFFWDKQHPTQNGWNAIYLALKPSLPKLIN